MVEYHFDVGTDDFALVRHFVGYTGDPPSAAGCNTLATHFMAQIVDFIVPQMNQASNSVKTVVTDLSSDLGATGEDASNVTGGLTNDPVGADTAFLVNGIQGRRYRGGKPRSYWPCGDSGVLLDPQHWTADFTATMQTAAEDVATGEGTGTAGDTATTGPVCVSYYGPPLIVDISPVTGRARNRSTKRAVPIVTPITAVVASQVLASQRRRVRKVR
jgi:hypothetical protein